MGNRRSGKEAIYSCLADSGRTRKDDRRMDPTGAKNQLKKTPAVEREKETVSREEPVAGIPPVVVVESVDVHVPAVVVVVGIETEDIVHETVHATAHRMLSGLYLIRDQ